MEQSCNLYLSHSSTDKFIININIVVKGLIVFANSVEYDQAHIIIAPIWKELSLRNTLYLADIYLLNAILFIFPIETAMEIKKFAFRQIEKYRNYQNIERLKINFLINLKIEVLKPISL